MFVNLEKELQSQKEKQGEALESVTKEIMLLQTADANEDLRILRGIGANSKQMVIEEKKGAQMIIDNFDNKFDGGIYTYAEIERLAIKYRLRFLRSDAFVGKMDVQCLAKIKELAKNNPQFFIDDNSLRHSFYILAPVSQFKTVRDTSKSPLRRSIDNFLSSFEDPLMFYKVDNFHYKFVHKWGKDFTIVRALIGAVMESRLTLGVTTAIVLMGLLSMLMAAFTFTWAVSPVSSSIALSIISIVGGIVFAQALKSSVFSKNNWDSYVKG